MIDIYVDFANNIYTFKPRAGFKKRAISKHNLQRIRNQDISMNFSKNTGEIEFHEKEKIEIENMDLAKKVFEEHDVESKKFLDGEDSYFQTISDLRHLRDEIEIIRLAFEKTKKFPELSTVFVRFPELKSFIEHLQS